MDLDAFAYDGPVGRGMVLVEEHHPLLDRHAWIAWVAGTGYYDAVNNSTVAPGNPLLLTPQPDNPFDPNAIAVCDATTEETIGHIGAAFVPGMQKVDRFAFALMEKVEDGARTGVLIVVAREPVTAHTVPTDAVLIARRLAHLPKMPPPKSTLPDAMDPIEAMQAMAHAIEEPKP